ncbi:MAG TPA: BamA/TamA family outer membrane protein [Spirochaetota bacterium]|nr:BamA/TamA family outer membrane protein [Spirochaetota bacterium]
MKAILQMILPLILLLVPYTLSAETKTIKEIKYSGLEKTRSFVVDSKILHKPGEPFIEELWIKEKNYLMDLDIFADVELEQTATDEGIMLHYRFTELPSFIIFPAMKRTDQDGLLMGPGLTIMNLFGEGIQQEFLNRFTIAPEPMRAKEFLSYTYIPDVYGLNMFAEVTVNYFNSYNTLKLYNENSFYSVAALTFKLPGQFSMIASFSSLNVKHDPGSTIFTADDTAMQMFYGDGRWDYIPGAGAGLVMDTRERIMNPHRGFYAETRYTLYGEKLGGDADYSEFIADFRGYMPAGLRHVFHLSLLGRYRPGTVPAYELYHTGGVNSLRTFMPDPDICGQHEFLGTLEYRYELFTGKQVSLLGLNGYYGLQLAAGMDNAVLWLPGESFEDGRYFYSFYAGVHLLVPALERVRLEFGFNTIDPHDRTVKFGINLGWYEKSYTQRRRVR